MATLSKQRAITLIVIADSTVCSSHCARANSCAILSPTWSEVLLPSAHLLLCSPSIYLNSTLYSPFLKMIFAVSNCYHFISQLVATHRRSDSAHTAPRARKHLPRRAWLYVDDLLLLLSKAQLQDSACLVIAPLSILGVPICPISWRKAQLGAKVTWCGWTFQFDHETVRLTTEKLAKLRQHLLDLQQSEKILRKKLESSLACLM